MLRVKQLHQQWKILQQVYLSRVIHIMLVECALAMKSEAGTLAINAFQKGSNVVIEIEVERVLGRV